MLEDHNKAFLEDTDFDFCFFFFFVFNKAREDTWFVDRVIIYMKKRDIRTRIYREFHHWQVLATRIASKIYIIAWRIRS